jgi:hypothetical protein
MNTGSRVTKESQYMAETMGSECPVSGEVDQMYVEYQLILCTVF